MPLVHCCRGVNRNLFRLRFFPATLGVRKNVVDDPWVVTVDPALKRISDAGRTVIYAEHLLYLECLESDVGSALHSCPRDT